jgi:hypothetical protein
MSPPIVAPICLQPSQPLRSDAPIAAKTRQVTFTSSTDKEDPWPTARTAGHAAPQQHPQPQMTAAYAGSQNTRVCSKRSGCYSHNCSSAKRYEPPVAAFHCRTTDTGGRQQTCLPHAPQPNKGHMHTATCHVPVQCNRPCCAGNMAKVDHMPHLHRKTRVGTNITAPNKVNQITAAAELGIAHLEIWQAAHLPLLLCCTSAAAEDPSWTSPG